jgi:hypothetical protein
MGAAKHTIGKVTSHGRMRLRRFSASSYGTTQIGEL